MGVDSPEDLVNGNDAGSAVKLDHKIPISKLDVQEKRIHSMGVFPKIVFPLSKEVEDVVVCCSKEDQQFAHQNLISDPKVSPLPAFIDDEYVKKLRARVSPGGTGAAPASASAPFALGFELTMKNSLKRKKVMYLPDRPACIFRNEEAVVVY